MLLIVQLTAVGQVNYQALNQYIGQARVDYGVTGLAVGVVQGEDIIFQNGYGLEDVTNESSKVSPSSNFAIASISKHFTAIALSTLVQQGKIKWHDKVSKYLPEFKLNDAEITKMLTVEDLLSHRSGLATFDGDLLWYGTNYTPEQILKRVEKRPLTKEFRDEFGYQNIMFIAAAQIIEKVSGQTWGDYLNQTFFRPLGMNKTVTRTTQFTSSHKVAYPHIKKSKISMIDYSNADGAVGVYTSVTDMAKWMIALLANGKYQGDSILAGKAINDTYSARTNLPVSNFDRENGVHFKSYGLGWFLSDYEGRKIVQHGGGLPGYISKIVLVPEENLGFIILTNDMTSLTSALTYKLLDEFLGKKGKKTNWAAKFLDYENKGKEQEQAYNMALLEKKVKKPVHSVSNEQFVGFYEDEMYGMAEVRMIKKRLELTLLPTKGLFNATLEPWNKDLFKITFSDEMLPDGLVSFSFIEGKVEGFTIDLPNPDFHFHKLEFKKQ